MPDGGRSCRAAGIWIRAGRGHGCDEEEAESKDMSTLTQTGEVTVTIEIGGEEISFSSGRLAKQADGAVVVRSGETMVLATAVGRTEAREGADFFPLTVDIEEKMYAAGQDPRRVLQARGQGLREGDAERAHGRSADPAALAQGIPERGPGHRDRAVDRRRARA